MSIRRYPHFVLLLSVLLVENASAQPTLFFTDEHGETIQRLDVTSGAVDTVLAATLFDPSGLLLDRETGKMYWASYKGGIRRANLDGTEIEDMLATGGRVDAIDPKHGNAYWTARLGGEADGRWAFYRGHLDGSSVEILADSTLVQGLWIDEEGGKMYYSAYIEATRNTGMLRSNLDFTDIEVLNDNMDPLPLWGFVIDPDTTVETDADGGEMKGLVYWPNPHEGIYRSRLDGTERTLLVAAGEGQHPYSLAMDAAHKKMYWETGHEPGWAGIPLEVVDTRIRRSNLDGTEQEDVATDPPSRLGGISIDAEHVYWINQSLRGIHRVRLDDGDREDLIVSPLSKPDHVDVDPGEGKVYWTEPGSKRVRRANLDGSEVETLALSEFDPYGIALDLQNRRLYWSTWLTGLFPPGDGNLYRANLDGSDAHQVVERGGPAAFDIAVDPDQEQVYCSVVTHHFPYDQPWVEFEGIIRVSFDGSEHQQVLWPLEEVDIYNPVLRVFEFALDPEANVVYWSFDDQMGRIELVDMDTTMFAYGEPGWSSQRGLVWDSESGDLYWASLDGDEGADATPSTRIERGSADGSGYETIALLEGVAIGNMALAPAGTVISAETTADLPAQHTLHPAYPNPFNPSVTLSYSLGEATWVRLEVLNVLGQTVATLADTFETSGHHSVRWDGRNQSGVSMPSGTYLYRLEVGTFSDTGAVVLAR